MPVSSCARAALARRALLALAAPALPRRRRTTSAPRKALRVCQDPNNLPFSNTKGEGIENRIAEVFGKALGLPVTYYSFPQRLAFIRNTLRYKLPGQDYRCDIVMGVPVGYDQVSVDQALLPLDLRAGVRARARAWTRCSSAADFLALDQGEARQAAHRRVRPLARHRNGSTSTAWSTAACPTTS